MLDGETTNDNATKAESVSETQAIPDKIGEIKSNENKDEKFEIVQGESAIGNSGEIIIKEKAKSVPYEQSNFDVTIWDREIHEVDELALTDLTDEETPFSKAYSKFSKIKKKKKQPSTAMVCKIRSCVCRISERITKEISPK